MKKRKSYYGIIGNGETCALISPTGSMEWLCLPRFDGTIVYAKALDPVNGESLDMFVTEKNKELLAYSASQKYVKNTNILRTKVRYKHITVEFTDFMPWHKSHIVRLVNIKNTSDKMRKITLKVQSGIGRPPFKKYKDLKQGDLIYNRGASLGIYFADKDLSDGGIFRIRPNKSAQCTIVLAYGKDRKEVKRKLGLILDPLLELQRCKRFWLDWIDRGKKLTFPNKIYEDMYYRCLLIIKLLIYKPTGAILASPTTSFPAVPGGMENWDYRFCWIRDGYFVCRAFLMTGHYAEVKKQLRFFYKVQGKDGHWQIPFYTIEGFIPKDELVIEEMQGPNKEISIKINNAAKDQLQLDSEGSVLHATYLYYVFTKDKFFLKKYWDKIEAATNWLCANYEREENGIWEFREKTAHWTYGKVLCYAGIESGIKIAEVLGKKVPKEWKRAIEKLKKAIVKKAWSNQRQAFLQTYDEDAPIDVSALAIEDCGLLRPTDSRIKKTVKLVESKLYIDGGIKRYEEALLPFYLPTLWLASHYIKAGDTRTAKKYLRTCINATTDLYLCGEHFDPKNKTQHGNFPQTFCVSSFIEQILNLKQTTKNVLRFSDIFSWKLIDIPRYIKFFMPKS